jgi:hypothetical protein
VPVTADLMIEKPDGTVGIDVAKFVQRAVDIGSAPATAWQPEERRIEPHPIQTPTPGLAESA